MVMVRLAKPRTPFGRAGSIPVRGVSSISSNGQDGAFTWPRTQFNSGYAHICGDIMTESKLEKDLNEFFRERNLQFNSISTNTFYQGVVYQIYAVKRLYKDTQLEIPFDYKD